MRETVALGDLRIDFGIPSYNEGRTILPTLHSLAEAARACAIEPLRVILSDSSETDETVDAARAWAQQANVDLAVDKSKRRRSIKEALNVILDRADAGILIVLVADVVIDASNLEALLFELIDEPQPAVAIGCAAPDPAHRDWRYRASRWQLNVIRRTAGLMPRDAPRAEGAFWGAWRSFYCGYRFPLGAGSIADDTELVRHLTRERIPARNAAEALVIQGPRGHAGGLLLSDVPLLRSGSPGRKAFHPRAPRRRYRRFGGSAWGAGVRSRTDLVCTAAPPRPGSVRRKVAGLGFDQT